MQSLRCKTIVRQVMPLPNACSFLEVERADLIVAIGLGLLQVAFLEQLLNQEEKHAWISREKVLNLVQRHVFRVTRRLKGAFDKVIRACD